MPSLGEEEERHIRLSEAAALATIPSISEGEEQRSLPKPSEG